jgi:hypothetical protein
MQKAAAPLVSAVSNALSPDVGSNDVFAPSNTTPEEYTTGLQEGITWNVAFLTKVLYEAKWDPTKKSTSVEGKVITLRSGDELTADGAKLLAETILDSSFLKEMPPLDLDVDTLTKKASLALWIGWALARDANYWNPKDAPIVNYSYELGKGWVPLPVGSAFWEQLDWEPVRKAIVLLGASSIAVTMQMDMPVGGERCLDPTFLRGPAYGLKSDDKRSPVASRRSITIAAAAV